MDRDFRFSMSVYHEMSERMYAFAIGFWVTIGLLIAGIAAAKTFSVTLTWPMLIVCFVIAMVGVFITIKSDEWLISAGGYVLVAGGLGALVGPATARYTEASVVQVLVVTALATIALSIVGLAVPQSLESWSGYLFAGLCLLIMGNVGRIFLAMFGSGDSLTFLDWLGAGLFMAYIVYDWNKAMHQARTMDNAVDGACALFLDILNLFLQLLSATGRRSD